MLRVLRILLVGFALAVTGCSLHTEVAPGFHRSPRGDVALEQVGPDTWGLLPVVRRELEEMGYEVLPAPSAAASLRARFVVEVRGDIAESGAPVERPNRLNLRLSDADGRLLARAEYHLGSTEDPQWGVKALFAGLRKELRKGGDRELSEKEIVSSPGPQQITPGPEPGKEFPPSKGGSPWTPRLRNWGVEDWGKDR